ncbi:pyruvate kinase [Babesia ovis]|uniref:Pyruvate kinase n=1 Tax=Babesia ovis TaxID=5869 RepID=A0A9W5TCX9_BABOV|nr:pyruvate kinase [Babesia ovis]
MNTLFVAAFGQMALAFWAMLALASGDGSSHSLLQQFSGSLGFLQRSNSQPERRYSSENTSYQQRNIRRNIYEIDAPATQQDAVDFFSHVLYSVPNMAFAPVEVPEGPFTTFTKQVSTMGPATSDSASIKSVMDAGTDVYRINFSHGTRTSKLAIARIIRQLETQPAPAGVTSAGHYMVNPKAILGDIQGPKLRIGRFQPNVDAVGKGLGNSDAEFVELKKGDEFTFDTSDIKGCKTRVQFKFPEILRSMEVGNVISLDDGNLTMRVISVDTNAPSVKTVVLNDGILSSRKGFAVPNIAIPVDLFSEKDVKDAVFCYALGLDFLGISFIQRMQDLLYMKNILLDFANSAYYQPLCARMNELDGTVFKHDEEDPEMEDILDGFYKERFLPYKHIFMTKMPEKDDVGIGLIPKIEKQPALDDINGILNVADGMMIARGDLGVETEITNLPVIQKRLVQLCRLVYRKPVIVATQMLESMRTSPMPTRAETTDCANAVYDGADAVMLSAESATGLNPAHAVRTQRLILMNAENDPYFNAEQLLKETLLNVNFLDKFRATRPREVAMIKSLVEPELKVISGWNARHPVLHISTEMIAEQIANEDIDALVMQADDHIELLQWVATKRFTLPFIFITHNINLARRMQLTWSVKPFVIPRGADPATFANELCNLYVTPKSKVLMVKCAENEIKSTMIFEVQ